MRRRTPDAGSRRLTRFADPEYKARSFQRLEATPAGPSLSGGMSEAVGVSEGKKRMKKKARNQKPARTAPAPGTGQPTAENAAPAAKAPAADLAPGATGGDSAILRTEGLVKIYSGRRVVNDVSLHLRQGEVVGLLGPNGAGKTTSFNMVIGLTRPTEGHVYIGDSEITRDAMYIRARKGIGYLAQEDSIFRKLTVEDNIRAILETLPGLTAADREERLEGILEEMGIAHVRKNLGDECSGGEKRRVEIARALVTRPRFMLLDEPFAAVDPKGVEDLQNIIHQMAQNHIGVLITDHSVRETLAITDRSYIIFEGKVEISGSAEFLIKDEKARSLYLGERFYMDTSEIIRR